MISEERVVVCKECEGGWIALFTASVWSDEWQEMCSRESRVRVFFVEI